MAPGENGSRGVFWWAEEAPYAKKSRRGKKWGADLFGGLRGKRERGQNGRGTGAFMALVEGRAQRGKGGKNLDWFKDKKKRTLKPKNLVFDSWGKKDRKAKPSNNGRNQGLGGNDGKYKGFWPWGNWGNGSKIWAPLPPEIGKFQGFGRGEERGLGKTWAKRGNFNFFLKKQFVKSFFNY